MTFGDLLLTAVALSMDALAVSITTGIALKNELSVGKAMKVGLFFGGFQALMPAVGFLLGRSIHHLIMSLDHWAAFFMLFIIGAKMLYDAIKGGEDKVEAEDPVATSVLLPLAIATSIDALAVGISLAMTDANLVMSISVIGLVTFVICVIGVLLGKQLRKILKNYAAMAGGVILMLIGLKILIEHLSAGI